MLVWSQVGARMHLVWDICEFAVFCMHFFWFLYGVGLNFGMLGTGTKESLQWIGSEDFALKRCWVAAQMV